MHARNASLWNGAGAPDASSTFSASQAPAPASRAIRADAGRLVRHRSRSRTGLTRPAYRPSLRNARRRKRTCYARRISTGQTAGCAEPPRSKSCSNGGQRPRTTLGKFRPFAPAKFSRAGKLPPRSTGRSRIRHARCRAGPRGSAQMRAGKGSGGSH